MPTFKKHFKATREYRCDFCRALIKVGEQAVCSSVKDEYGRYTLRFHPECDRTSALNELTKW